MRILYINHYAGAPTYGMEFRPYYLAHEWVRLGNRVLILGAAFSHVRAQQPKRPAECLGCWAEQIDGIDYQWYSTPPYSGNGVSRVRNIATFLIRVVFDINRLVREFQPDVVIASSTYPMDIWPARWIARKAGAKLVFELHDLWPLSPIEIGGMSPSHPFIRLCQAAENAAYRDADMVVSMLPNVGDYAASKGLPAERLVIVPNGISLDDWQAEQGAPLREDVKKAIDSAHALGQRIVVYAGSHGLPNALDTLLDAAALLRDKPICFILVGDGHERNRLQQRVRDEGLDHVLMFVPIPKKQMSTLLADVDMAYLGALPLAIYRFGVAMNKMFDYMMAGLPILYAIEAGNNPVADAGCGLTMSPENPRALATGILELTALPHERLKAMGDNGRNFVKGHHTYNVLAKNFLDAIERIPVR